MTDILKSDEFSELLHEYGETPEIQGIIGELFTPEMMSRKMLSNEFQACLKRLELQLITLEKNDAVRYGQAKEQ